jgi:hypothetical protein
MSTMTLSCAVAGCAGSVRYDGPKVALGAARPAPHATQERTESEITVYLRCDGPAGHVRGYKFSRDERP